MSKIVKSLFMLSIIFISLLCVGAVCAADIADDTVSAIDDLETIESDNIIDDTIQESAVMEEPQAADEESPIAEDESTKTFTQLITDIGDESSEVTLTGTYKFDSEVDTAYPVISRDLTINGPATIDGNGLTRLFAVTGGTLTLKNLNLINGFAGETMMDAGAVLAQGGNLVIQGCTFKDNKAYRVGGAIRVASGSSLKVTDSTFESCEAIGNQAGQGGAFTVGSSATGLEVRNCTFIDCNTTTFGGAIDTAFPNSIISGCNFISNRVGTYGGAVAVRGANTIVEDSIFKGNTGGNGGSAIIVYDVDATITNCIFDSNIAPSDSEYGYQGTVYLSVNPQTPNENMNVAISKCIFTNNSALEGSAITSYLSNFIVENSIFLDNIATDEAYNLGPEATVIFLIDDSESPKTAVVNNNWFGSTVDNYTAELQTFNETFNMWQGISNVKIDNWYFLDLKETAKSNGYDILISLNNLYDNATAKVTKVTDCALPDYNASLSVTAGNVSPSIVTLKNGVATVKYALNGSQGPGTIAADLSGIIVRKKLEGVKLGTAITVSPLKRYTYNKTVDAKSSYYIYATLKDSKGNILKGKTVKVVSKGKTYNLTTDSKGRVKLLVAYAAKGTYKQTFTFLGDKDYKKSTHVVYLKVIAQKVKLTAPKKTFKASAKTKKLTATLKNSKGKALKGKKIAFTVNGKKYTGKTNAKGVATVKVSLSKKKTYKVTVKFAGDKTYNKLTKTSKVVIK